VVVQRDAREAHEDDDALPSAWLKRVGSCGGPAELPQLTDVCVFGPESMLRLSRCPAESDTVATP
jgi:hypothetical protein